MYAPVVFPNFPPSFGWFSRRPRGPTRLGDPGSVPYLSWSTPSPSGGEKQQLVLKNVFASVEVKFSLGFHGFFSLSSWGSCSLVLSGSKSFKQDIVVVVFAVLSIELCFLCFSILIFSQKKTDLVETVYRKVGGPTSFALVPNRRKPSVINNSRGCETHSLTCIIKSKNCVYSKHR